MGYSWWGVGLLLIGVDGLMAGRVCGVDGLLEVCGCRGRCGCIGRDGCVEEWVWGWMFVKVWVYREG